MIAIRSSSASMRVKAATGRRARRLNSPVPGLTARVPSRLLHERIEEEQEQRNQQDVDDQRLDEHEAQEQRAADVAGSAGIPRDGFGRRADGLPLTERAEAGGNSDREDGGEDGPPQHLGVAGWGRRFLRVENGIRREGARGENEGACQNGTFAHDPSLLKMTTR